MQIAEEAEELLQQAIDDILNNPTRCQLRLTYALYQLAHIRRVLTEAKTGK